MAARSLGTERIIVILLGLALAGILGWLVTNWAYQVARKPSELVGLISPAAAKTQRTTWEAYGHLFRRHSTDIVSPALLAALAQVESTGHPHARTFWRWRWSWNPFDLYAPASSAVGLFQMTDGALAEARQYCIHDHRVARAGAWHDWEACWFNGLYSRLWPSHAVELTAAHLHVQVEDTLRAARRVRVSPDQQQDLASVIHLCGPERGLAYARRGFQPTPGERCGSHDLAGYVDRVRRLRQVFARWTTREP
jgi:hypothetical protein